MEILATLYLFALGLLQTFALGVLTFLAFATGIAALPQMPRKDRVFVVTVISLLAIITSGYGLIAFGLLSNAAWATHIAIFTFGLFIILQIIFRLTEIGYGFHWINLSAIIGSIIGILLLINR